MNLLDNIAARWLGRRSSVANPSGWLVRMFGGRETKAGIRVSERTALTCGPLLAGVRILSETAAQLPLKVYRRLPGGGKEPAIDHPLYDVLALNPNPEYTSFEWRERVMADAVVWGNSYCQLIEDFKGNVREIWPLDPGRMRVERAPDGGDKRYVYYRKTGNFGDYQQNEVMRVFSPHEILHVSLLGDGLKGYSLVDLCAEAIGIALTAEEFAASFFAHDSVPPLIFESDQKLTAKDIELLRQGWEGEHKGSARASRTGWTWGGMKSKLLERDLSKVGLKELRQFQVEEIARVLRIPLHMMQSLERATNNNIEHQGLEYAIYTATPWFVRIEQRISKSLFGPRESGTYFAEFDMDGLLRGDYVSRTTGIGRLVASACMTPNEGRYQMGMNPIEGGDKLYIQGAMVPLEMAGKKQQGKPAQPAA